MSKIIETVKPSICHQTDWKKVLKEKTVLKRRKFGHSDSLFLVSLGDGGWALWLLRIEIFWGIFGKDARLEPEASFCVRL